MESLIVTRPVRVLVRVTEGFRQKVRQRSQREIQRLEAELQQLDLQGQRWEKDKEKGDPSGAADLRQVLRRERAVREKRRAELRARIRKLGDLQDGQLVQQGTVEAEAVVAVGMSWDRLMNAAVVIEDGKVVQIRSGRIDGEG